MSIVRRTPLCLALCLFAVNAQANGTTSLDRDTVENAQKLALASESGSEAYAILESLTSEVGPRMAGTPAFDRAVVWAQEKFKALGYDKVYLEPVTFPTWERRHEAAQILAPFPQKLMVTALGGSVGTGATPLDAEVIEFATLDALKAAPAGSLTGKIAYISNRMARHKDGSGYGPAVVARSGASDAASKGAVALIIRSIGTDSDRLPHTGMQRYAEGGLKIPAAALSNPDADLLSNIIRRGKPVTVRLDIDAGMSGKLKTEHNVIGEIRGRSKPDEVVVIGGHLDSWDLGTGAVDDGAGVAITMAAGAMIGRLDKAPARTIRVVAFANEEQGLFGGRAYAETHKAEIDQQQLGAESDFGAGRIYAFRAGVADEARPVIEQIGQLLAPLGIAYEATGGEPGPDIGPFAKAGMPWGDLAQDGTDYFDLHHTANDTLDKVEAKALDQQVAAYAVMAYAAANSPVDFGRAPPIEEQK
ncbi:MAG: M28 family peptidase [Arenimonas sp.]|nr:M28 family peptidase [Arenimonas sp.]